MNNQSIPPQYNPDEWEGKDFNCYAYALRLCINLTDLEIIPGLISKETRPQYMCTKEHILRYFEEDCEALGLQAFPSSMQEQINTTEYKIAIYVDEGWDVHFARQDSNGNWSEKRGWIDEINILPQESVTKDYDSYKFIGVFRVSKK